MITLACYNIKGGVGKTATAVNLAYLAAQSGIRTLVWDLDPQAAASYYFRIKAKVKKGSKGLLQGKQSLADTIKGTDFELLDLVPADFSYRNMDLLLEDKKNPERKIYKLLKPLAEDYDLVILDCPPSISLFTESVFYTADYLLVPTIPTTLSLRTLEQLLRFYNKEGLNEKSILPFFSMVDLRKSLHKTIIQNPPKTLPAFLQAHIPYASEIEQMGTHRTPLPVFASASRAGKAYQSLWAEFSSLMDTDN
jgi:cellulose biosynthesis protein BcsQ